MKIFIRADASIQIGTGHIRRCLVLADELRKNGADIAFFCRNAKGDLSGTLKALGYEVCTIPPTLHFRNEKKYIAHIVERKGRADYFVIDHYGIDSQYENDLERFSDKILVIDDLANRPHNCNFLLDHNFYPGSHLRYRYLLPDSCITLLGPQYALLRPEFDKARKMIRRNKGAAKRLLIFFGGSDPTNETKKALEAIKLREEKNISTDVVIGAINPNARRIKTIVSGLPNAVFHYDIKNMAEIMFNADFSIGAGGISIWERCCLGLATITIAVAENQIKPLEALAGQDIVLNLGWHKYVKAVDIAKAVEKMLHSKGLLKSISKKSAMLVDGHGRIRATNILMADFYGKTWYRHCLDTMATYLNSPKGFRFELINARHTPYIIKWRNDPFVQRRCLKRDGLTEEKQKVFLSNYKNRDRLDFVLISCEHDKPVGLFSIKNISTVPEIGKLIGDPGFRNKGIAKAATCALLEFAFDYLMLRNLWAKTQKSNAPNIRLNENIGFKTERTETLNGEDYLVMRVKKENFLCAESLV